MYSVHDDLDQLVMIAPLKTISKYLNLHRDAEARITRETAAGLTCTLYAGRTRLNTAIHHKVHKVENLTYDRA
jgi:hypothetical protein